MELFRPAEMDLVPVNVTTWRPLVFANLDGKAPPLPHMMEDIPRRVQAFGCEPMQYVTSRRWEIACNGKVSVDNF